MVYKYIGNIYIGNIYIQKTYTNFFNKVKNLFTNKTENQILGRWCHISLPKCCNNVIEKKIDFANRDNNYN